METRAVYKRNGYFGFGPIEVTVEPGQILGVRGGPRSGKTSLMCMLWGFMLPDRGDVKVFGLPPCENPVAVRNRAGYVPHHPRFYESERVQPFLEFIGSFHKNWDMPYVLNLLEEFGIAKNEVIYNIQDEARVRLALAAASGHRPELMILDEPHFTKTVMGFLRKRIREDNIAVVVTSTDSRELDPVADMVVEIKNGTLISNHP